MPPRYRVPPDSPGSRLGSGMNSLQGRCPPARWDAIVDDLSARGVSGEPALVSAEAVTWPSSALGCPAPGRSYAQAIVEGMRIVVEVDGTTYDYRFGRSDTPMLCEAEPGGTGERRPGRPYRPGRPG